MIYSQNVNYPFDVYVWGGFYELGYVNYRKL